MFAIFVCGLHIFMQIMRKTAKKQAICGERLYEVKANTEDLQQVKERNECFQKIKMMAEIHPHVKTVIVLVISGF